MSSSGFEPCRVFELGTSRRLALALIGLHVATASALFAAQLPWTVRVAAVALLVLSARRALSRHANRTGSDAVVRLVRRADGRWAAIHRDGTALIGPLAGDSFIHPWLTIVGIRDGWRTCWTPVPADALSPDDHRRLRVWVKWQPPSA